MRVIAVDEHFGLHDRHDAFRLADRRVRRQRFRVGLDAERRGIAVGDAVDLAPLGEARALSLVGLETLGQAIEAARDQIAGRIGEGHRALVDLDAGNDAASLEDSRQRRSVVGALAERLLEQDDAADECFDARRVNSSERYARRFSSVIGDAERLKSLADRRQALVGGEDALARSYQLLHRRLKFLIDAHTCVPFFLLLLADQPRQSCPMANTACSHPTRSERPESCSSIPGMSKPAALSSSMSIADSRGAISTSGGLTRDQSSSPVHCATARFIAAIIGYLAKILRTMSRRPCIASASLDDHSR